MGTLELELKWSIVLGMTTIVVLLDNPIKQLCSLYI